jgi:predicted Zn-dependent protease
MPPTPLIPGLTLALATLIGAVSCTKNVPSSQLPSGGPTAQPATTGQIVTKSEPANPASLLVAAGNVLAEARLDNVAAAKKADVVFLAAKEMRGSGKLELAGHYYVSGLQLRPWDMRAQLEYALLLRDLHQDQQAQDVARLVLNMSEQQELREAGARLLGQQLARTLDALPAAPTDEVLFCFVKIGDCDDWLLEESGRLLARKLGVRVFIHPGQIALPAADRSLLAKWRTGLASDLNWDHPGVRAEMAKVGIRDQASATTEQVIELVSRLYVISGKEDPKSKLLEAMSQTRERDKQWNADPLLGLLKQQLPRRRDVVWIGITAEDLYSGSSNFVFGTAETGGKFSLVSIRRFTAKFNQDRENGPRLVARVHKQLLSSVGFALGIPRPTDPRSARSYPNSLDDHDAKETWLSRECIKGFELALAHPLPKATWDETNQALGAPHTSETTPVTP